MSAEHARLFFALWPPAALAEQLADLARQLAETDGGRPTRSETIHLTLAFLGALPLARLDELQQAAAGVRQPAFDLTIDRLDYWHHNSLLWAGCAEQPALSALVAALRQALKQTTLTVDGENRPFLPHLTLLRKLREKPATPTLPALAAWPCRRFVLVRSQLSATGSNYEIIGEFPLLP